MTVQAQNASPPAALTPAAKEKEEIEKLEEEVGDRDPTYLRTRMVLKYDHERLDPASIDRFQLKLLYALGPNERLAVSILCASHPGG